MVNCLALLVNQLCAGSYSGALQTTASGSKKKNKKKITVIGGEAKAYQYLQVFSFFLL